MMKKFNVLFIVFSFVLICSSGVAQRTFNDGDYFKITFYEFVQKIEAQSDYKFFYKNVWTDSLKVTVNIKNKNIQDILQTVFENTELRFLITEEKEIYVTLQREIMADLPEDFATKAGVSKIREAAFDYSEYESREKQRKLEEVKLYSIGQITKNLDGTATLTGTVRELKNGEPLIGASVYIEMPLIGASTDQNGYFSLTIPKGRHELKIKSIGMKATVRQIMLYANGRLSIEMQEEITPLKEVIIESERDVMVKGMQMGMEKLDIKTMKQLPLALGETDIMKVVMTLPGVQTVGEGTVGLNVRGGSSNQNLILFNDAVVYNPSHLFGFFSTFNPDVLKNVELYKSGISADYGGRLSSVLDVHSREGNVKKISGTGGISPVTGRFTIEGPIIKDKTSFILGVRSTYSNWLLRQLNNPELSNSLASFYDITGNVTHKINDNNSLYLSGYISRDKFRLNDDTTYNYSDRNAALKWKFVINNKMHGTVATTYSRYGYSVESDQNPAEAFSTKFNMNQISGKTDFHYYPNSKHNITAGLQATRYEIHPGSTEPLGEESIRKPQNIEQEQGLESAIYVGENYDVNNRLSVYGGLRYSMFNYLGEQNVYSYGQGSRESKNVTDTIHYNSGESIASYHGLEPRLSLRYTIGTSASVKISYNRMRQYIQMLSNTTAVTPTDIWKLADNYITPQIGDQYSLGLYKNMKGNLIETSIEGYYKDIIETIDYKNGASLLENGDHLETEVIPARGKAYGVEFFIKKSSGKLNGWISYTYSRTFLKTTGAYSAEVVNNGKYYPSGFDKPHALNFIGNYKFNRRINFSLNVIYSTGRPVTIPIAKYDIEGTQRVFYGDRNANRIPDYFRMDISLNLEGNHKVDKPAHGSWTLAVYNLTGRPNSYSVYFVTEGQQIKGYSLSIFARPIPTLTYNFKF